MVEATGERDELTLAGLAVIPAAHNQDLSPLWMMVKILRVCSAGKDGRFQRPMVTVSRTHDSVENEIYSLSENATTDTNFLHFSSVTSNQNFESRVIWALNISLL